MKNIFVNEQFKLFIFLKERNLGMNQEKITLLSHQDELQLDVLLVQPDETCRGVIQIVHGMAEYKERYLPFMECMAEHGYACVIHDHRGHGKSVKAKEDLGYFYEGGKEALIEDTFQVTQFCKERYPMLPLILLGHSMGSLIARNFIRKYDDQIDILIVTGAPSKNPAVDLGLKLVKVLRKLYDDHYRSDMLQKIAFGGYALKFRGESSHTAWICSDPQVVKAYDQSEECGFVFTLDGFGALFGLLEETYRKTGWDVKNPRLPILFLGGEKDPCIGSARQMRQSMRFLKDQGYVQVTGKRYPHMRHEILNEIGKETVYENILSYIAKRNTKENGHECSR
jgi:alpha-beta hydrolase superfamily lysophospholipase